MLIHVDLINHVPDVDLINHVSNVHVLKGGIRTTRPNREEVSFSLCRILCTF